MNRALLLTLHFYGCCDYLQLQAGGEVLIILEMGKAEKALDRIKANPSDYRWNELTRLMESFGYEVTSSGGSSRKFLHRTTRAILMLHEPHPTSILKAYQVRAVLRFLQQERHL